VHAFELPSIPSRERVNYTKFRLHFYWRTVWSSSEIMPISRKISFHSQISSLLLWSAGLDASLLRQDSAHKFCMIGQILCTVMTSKPPKSKVLSPKTTRSHLSYSTCKDTTAKIKDRITPLRSGLCCKYCSQSKPTKRHSPLQTIEEID
jgi:hypothetical protein